MTRGPAHIVLIGPPRAGTSTVGSRLARHVGRPFIDIDASSVRPGHRQAQSSPDFPASGAADVAEPTPVEAAECEWLAGVLATSGPLVVGAPWSAIHVIADFNEPRRLWRVWLDAPDDVLVRRATSEDGVADEDFVGYLRKHTHPHRDIAERVADFRVDSATQDAATVAGQIFDRWVECLDELNHHARCP